MAPPFLKIKKENVEPDALSSPVWFDDPLMPDCGPPVYPNDIPLEQLPSPTTIMDNSVLPSDYPSKLTESETASEKSTVEGSNDEVVNAETNADNTGGVTTGAFDAETDGSVTKYSNPEYVDPRDVNALWVVEGVTFTDVTTGASTGLLSLEQTLAEFNSPTGNLLVKGWFLLNNDSLNDVGAGGVAAVNANTGGVTSTTVGTSYIDTGSCICPVKSLDPAGQSYAPAGSYPSGGVGPHHGNPSSGLGAGITLPSTTPPVKFMPWAPSLLTTGPSGSFIPKPHLARPSTPPRGGSTFGPQNDGGNSPPDPDPPRGRQGYVSPYGARGPAPQRQPQVPMHCGGSPAAGGCGGARITHARTVSDTSSTGVAGDQSPMESSQYDVDPFEAQADVALASELSLPLEQFKKMKMNSAKNLVEHPLDTFYESQQPTPIAKGVTERRSFTDKNGKVIEYNWTPTHVDRNSSYNNISDDNTKLPRSICIILGLKSPEDLDNMDEELQRAANLAVAAGIRHPALSKATSRIGRVVANISSASASASASTSPTAQEVLQFRQRLRDQSAFAEAHGLHYKIGQDGQPVSENGGPAVSAESPNTSANLPNASFMPSFQGPADMMGQGGQSMNQQQAMQSELQTQAMQQIGQQGNSFMPAQFAQMLQAGAGITTLQGLHSNVDPALSAESLTAPANHPNAGAIPTIDTLHSWGFRQPDNGFPGGLPPPAVPGNSASAASANNVEYDMSKAGDIWKDLFLSGKLEEASLVLEKARSTIMNGPPEHMYAIDMIINFGRVGTAAIAELVEMGVESREYYVQMQISLTPIDPDDMSEDAFHARVQSHEAYKENMQVKDSKIHKLAKAVKAVQVLHKYKQPGATIPSTPSHKKRKSISTPQETSSKKKAVPKTRTPSKPRAPSAQRTSSAQRAPSAQRTPSQSGNAPGRTATSIQFGVIPEHLAGNSEAQVAYLQGQIAIMQQLHQAEDDQ
ncbi:uncharacterized protein PAC_07213 [Phialocephala subalpina]|uniref:Uncharacterized protein n=1 Tax=Phialocephala subalpina TaxID=576137 RepID=A0A1L7WX34_9HELO|nr:uncharacterized protein PAC_07213 [Phialocephala subalpina]